jgi:Tol biopolymer transport system component
MIISSDIKGGAQLFEVYLSGSNRGRLRHIPTNISRECTEPAWNPTDPNILAFTANIGGRSQIVIYNFQTRESRSLKSNTDDEGPSWTNDGRHLVFAALKGGAHQLHMLDTVTNKRTELHTSKSSFSSPDFVYPRRSR